MRRARVLVVDDDPKIVASLRLYLEHAGYEVASAGDGQKALAAARSFGPDLVVLDVMLPRGDGLSVCRALRAESEVSILFLSARSLEEDRLEGLDLGADDYVTKPFSPREVVARVRAILRRAEISGAARKRRDEAPSWNSPSPEPAEAAIRLPGLLIDPARHEVLVRGERVELTPREFRILVALARDPGRVLSRDELAERALGPDYEGLARTVDAHVANLRRKIEPDPSAPVFVETVFGVGYRLRGGRRAP
ncbi:MAG: response regulator transcription factor [Bacteroidota bacterium]